MVFKQGPTLGDAASLSIECADCGHSRWRKPEDLYGRNFCSETMIAEISEKLYCSPCRADGLPGRNISVQVAFVTEARRREADAWLALKSQKVRAAG